MVSWRGLLDTLDEGATGFDQLLAGGSTVPEGAGYTVADQRAARMAMLGSAGATLLAAAQPGPIGSRGQHLAQLANIPLQGAQLLQQAGQQRMQRDLMTAQVQALRDKREGGQALAAALTGRGGAGAPMGVAPASAATPVGPPATGGTAPVAAPPGYYGVLSRVESGGNNNARPIDPNTGRPASSALGQDQFTEGTWLDFAKANPGLFPANASREQIMAARTNPDLMRRGSHWYAGQNAAVLEAARLPVNDSTVALAHRFGPGGAPALLRADRNAPASSVLSPEAIEANPSLRNATVGQVIDGVTRAFGTGNTWRELPGAASAGGGGAPAAPATGAVRTPGLNGNTLANMPQELREIAANLARRGDVEGATKILTDWIQRTPPQIQTTTVNGRVREVMPSGELGRDYGQAGSPDGRPITPEDRARFPNLDPRKEYYMRDGVPHEVGNQSTNVSIQTDTAGRESAMRRIDKAREQSDPVMSGAVPQALMMREQLMTGIATGKTEDLTLTARQWAQSLGLLTPQQAANADQQTVFRAMSSSMIPRMRAAGSGSSSDLDVRMFSQAAPNLATSPMGNLVISSAFIQTAEHEQLRIAAMEEYLAEKGNLVGFDRHWRSTGPSLFPRVSKPEDLAQHQPGTVVILPDEPQVRERFASSGTFPFYVVPRMPAAPPAAAAAP